jgi:NADP-dependent 3-hydroxy acid dehydrogenase YdfG
MKKIAVSGATKGIGRAIAEKFLKEGYEVAVCARKGDELLAMEQSVRASGLPGILHTVPCDVTRKEHLKAFYEFVKNTMGSVDILVNNAGIFEPGTIYGEEDGVLERQMATNVYSTYHLSRMFLPAMMERKSGHIFNLCSVASIKAYTNGGSYCISKFAVYGMTKVLREELKPFNIKVTAVLPGATLSGSWEGTTLPEERFMKATDIADAVFMASQLSPSAVVEEIIIRPMEGDIE